MSDLENVPHETLTALRRLAGDADAATHWPAESWDVLKKSRVLEWCIPEAYGGRELSAWGLLSGYEKLASACLTTCFILSQREAACRRIRDHGAVELCSELLPPLARGEWFATIGLSHLTTSRQHTAPAMRARPTDRGFILDGVMPWVTGAEKADYFITGATLEDGKQIMIVLPRHSDGLTVGPPLELMALAGSMTAEVHCCNVEVRRRWLLAGPTERVMAVGKGGTGGLETSALALGLAGAAVDYLHDESRLRLDLIPITERLGQTRQALRAELRRLAETGGTPEAMTALRAKANAHVLRASQAALTASKGTGYLKNHPAQRWVRQSMFFLVWSCPRPAAEATLAYLMPVGGIDCA